nr:hypothetical protein CFP56_53919 [Quercus suber]
MEWMVQTPPALHTFGKTSGYQGRGQISRDIRLHTCHFRGACFLSIYACGLGSRVALEDWIMKLVATGIYFWSPHPPKREKKLLLWVKALKKRTWKHSVRLQAVEPLRCDLEV